jgi:hypothetical protein
VEVLVSGVGRHLGVQRQSVTSISLGEELSSILHEGPIPCVFCFTCAGMLRRGGGWRVVTRCVGCCHACSPVRREDSGA